MAPPESVDACSGYCAVTRAFRSKRAAVLLPADPSLDVVAFLARRHHGPPDHLPGALAAPATALPAVPLSLRKGDVALILSPNSVRFPVAALGAMSLGAVVTTANPLNTAAEIAKQCADARPALAFATRDLLPKLPNSLRVVLLEPAAGRLPADDPRILATIDEISATPPDPARRRGAAVTQDDQATLLYSSGTTGPSKGS